MSLDRYKLGDAFIEAPPSTFYYATNAVLGHEVMIRRLTVDPARAEDMRETFFREQRLAASLAHPHIQRPLDIFAAEGALWSVHEVQDERGLASIVAEGERLTLEESARLGAQVADALSHMHERGYVHGRIAPQSLLRNARGDALLINLVKASDLHAGIWPLRAPVQALGPHTAPEEHGGGKPTPASDIYGLASTVVTWIAGTPPGADAEIETTMPGLPPALAARLSQALRSDPAQRPPSVAALGAVLSEVHQRAAAEIPTGFERGALLQPTGEVEEVVVRGRIGAGAFGIVLDVEATAGGARYALKALKPEHRDDRQAHERFLREARALRPLNNKHVIRIRGVGEHGGTPYVVMDRIDGPDLGTVILRQGALPPRRSAELGLGIAHGVQAIHDAGLVHRDLKPHNILLAGGTCPVIADFGMASGKHLTRLTMTGQAVGTPAYMAPEQLDDGPDNASVDLWSVGVMLQEMLTGDVPFVAEGTLEMIRAIRTAHPLPLPDEVPEWLSAIVRRLLEKDPARRYAQACDVAAALQQGLDT